MADKTFQITGRIIAQAGQGVKGLQVKAWAKDFFFDDLIGSTETDAEGFFEI